MKKHIFLLLLLFAMPALVLPVTEEGITIAKFSMDPLPFNERRDPSADSPYNAFDGDIRTAALYSDFTVEFSRPVNIDQLKIMNGNASGKDAFKRDNRERDIEITLYTVAYKPDNKTEKKSRKSKKVQPKPAEKKAPSNDKDTKSKTAPEKIEKDKTDKEIKENKKTEIPDKVVLGDEYDTIYASQHEGIKLYFTASETVIEPDKKTGTVKPDTENKKDAKEGLKKVEMKPVKEIPAAKKPGTKKTEKKKTEIKKPEKKKETKAPSSKVKTPAKKTEVKKQETPVKKKENSSSGNIIEITDSKKDNKKTGLPADKKDAVTSIDIKTEPLKKDAGDTGTKKSLAGDRPGKPETVKTEKKKPAPEIKNSAAKKSEKKSAVKNADKKTSDKTAVKKPSEEKKSVKTDAMKKESVTVKTPADKKKEPVKEAKKETIKDNKKPVTDKKPSEDIKVNKMAGIVRIENDKEGRVLVYASLKDSMELQNIDLKGEYAVTKIDFRTRDDEYYTGSVPDRSAITEINLFNNGKKVAVQGIDALKKSYVERYTQKLKDSLTDETFIMYENNDVVLRMKFRKDGRMEFFDRFKCSKKGDPDCTNLSMPDMWKVTDGKLLMRYHTLWRVWKYELDSQNDMLSDNEDQLPPRWMKLYFKSDTGFTDQYLELYRSEKGIWAE